MYKPIINPSTLTEEQREQILEIRDLIKDNLKCKENILESITISDLAEGQRVLFVELFGKELFEK